MGTKNNVGQTFVSKAGVEMTIVFVGPSEKAAHPVHELFYWTQSQDTQPLPGASLYTNATRGQPTSQNPPLCIFEENPDFITLAVRAALSGVRQVQCCLIPEQQHVDTLSGIITSLCPLATQLQQGPKTLTIIFPSSSAAYFVVDFLRKSIAATINPRAWRCCIDLMPATANCQQPSWNIPFNAGPYVYLLATIPFLVKSIVNIPNNSGEVGYDTDPDDDSSAEACSDEEASPFFTSPPFDTRHRLSTVSRPQRLMVPPAFRSVSSSGLQAHGFQQALDEETEESHGMNSAELTMVDSETCGQRCHKRSDITWPMSAPQKRSATNKSLQGAAIRSDLNGAGDTPHMSESKQQRERQDRLERREQRTQTASVTIVTAPRGETTEIMVAAARMVELVGTDQHQTRQQRQKQTAVDAIVGAPIAVGAARLAEATTTAAGVAEVAGTLGTQWEHGTAGQSAITAVRNTVREIKRYRLNSTQYFSYGWNVCSAPTIHSNILARVLHGKLLQCSHSQLAGTKGWLMVEAPCTDDWFSLGAGSAWVELTANFNNGWHPVDE